MVTSPSPTELLMYWTRGLDASVGCPWNMPVSDTPWLRVPDAFTSVTGALVASGNAVGLDGGGTTAAEGTEVAAGADVAEGALVALGALGALVAGTAVAEDPHASIKAANKRTIPIVQCFLTCFQ